MCYSVLVVCRSITAVGVVVGVQVVSQEESKLEPWTLLAKYHLKAEQELRKVEK